MSERRGGSSLAGARWLAAMLILLGGGGGMLTAYVRWSGEQRALDAAFHHAAEQVTALVLREVTDYLAVLESVGALHLLSPDITARSFSEFVQKGMLYQQRVLGVFGLAPRVPGHFRRHYERAMQEAGRPGYRILEVSADAPAPVRAAARSFYFPVSYVVPEAGDHVPVGLNLSASPAWLEAMQEAARAASPHAVGWLRNEERKGILIVTPTGYRSPAPPESPPIDRVSGFAFAVMPPASVLERALANHQPPHIHIAVTTQLEGEEHTLYIAGPSPDGEEDVPGSWPYQRTILPAGLLWRVHCAPSSEFARAHQTALPWLYGIGGMILTALIAGYALQLAGQAQRVRRLVDERTDELMRANEELAREIGERHALQRQIINISTREKAKIGRDLHDSLGQQLTGIGLYASALANGLQGGDPSCAEQARHLAEQLREVRQMARRMARGLTPVEMDAEGLPQALERMLEDMSSASGIPCMLEGIERFRMTDQEAATHLYLLAQEAVNNAVQHARPGRIVMSLHENRIVIEDDGRGYRPDHGGANGLGMSIMRYRAEMIGASLCIEEREPRGTRIVLSWQETANGVEGPS